MTGGTGADLRNVTAIAPLSGGVGVLSDAAFGDTQSVSLRNVIARGPADGQGIQAADDPGIGDSVTVTVSSSNYSSLDDDEPEADIVESGPANQTASPAFANAATGNFHQLSNSLTIDAGSVDPLLGELDIDGEARIQGAAPDIGADEFTVTPDQPPARPTTSPPRPGSARGPRRRRSSATQVRVRRQRARCDVRVSARRQRLRALHLTRPGSRGSNAASMSSRFARWIAAGNRDPTPADRRWKSSRRRR